MKNFLKKINMIDEYVTLGLFAIMCIAVLSQMVMRIVFDSALLFTEEVARFSYIWIVFIGLSIGEKHSEHFCVEVFLKSLTGLVNKIVQFLTISIITATYCYLFYWSLKFFAFQMIIISAALEISMSVVALGLCVGLFIGIIRCSTKLVLIVNDIIEIKKQRR